MFKKSIVLSDIESNTNKKAVLTLEKKEDEVLGTLRLYNFPVESEGLLTLGFYVGDKVVKSGLTRKGNAVYSFFLSDNFIDKKFSCALVEFLGSKPRPILYGASEGRSENAYADIISELSGNLTVQNVENVLDKHNVDYDEQEKEQIEKEIDDCMKENRCENCPYKKYFFENNPSETQSLDKSENDKEKVEDIIEEDKTEENNDKNGDEESFITRLKPQIDKLFEKNPIENNLQSIIPNSKWVKIEYEDDGDFYVFGLLYEDEKIKYVCYGVPAVYEEEPPKELSGYPTFLPLNKDEKKGFGYWLTYQDAETGEPIKAVIE